MLSELMPLLTAIISSLATIFVTKLNAKRKLTQSVDNNDLIFVNSNRTLAMSTKQDDPVTVYRTRRFDIVTSPIDAIVEMEGNIVILKNSEITVNLKGLTPLVSHNTVINSGTIIGVVSEIENDEGRLYISIFENVENIKNTEG